MQPIKTIAAPTGLVLIYQDPDPYNPREESDHLATMYCWHRRYRLGDTHDFRNPQDLTAHLGGDIDSISRDHVRLPLYLYDHSGITMSTEPFSCPWDSGQVGWIVISMEAARGNWSGSDIEIRRQALECLRAEVAEYDAYLRGDVYGFRVTSGGEEVDSCWGFYSIESAQESAMEALPTEDPNREFDLAEAALA